MFLQYVETPLGVMEIRATQTAVTRISARTSEEAERPGPYTQAAAKQLTEYFAGLRRAFDLPIAPEGTAFQKKVWAALHRVPYGEALTYGELGAQVGCRGAQAIGQAVGRNPLLIVVPCHRVLASGGKKGGFSAGLWRKEILLKLEKIPFSS